MVRHKFHLKQWELVRDEAGQFLADIRVCGILETLGEIGVNKKCSHIDEPRFKCHNCGTYQRSKEIEREARGRAL